MQYPHEVFEALACGTLQSINTLACMLVERLYKLAWRLSCATACVAARLSHVKVRECRLQAVTSLTVRVFVRSARPIPCTNWYSKDSYSRNGSRSLSSVWSQVCARSRRNLPVRGPTLRLWIRSQEGFEQKCPVYVRELYPYTLQPHPEPRP